MESAYLLWGFISVHLPFCMVGCGQTSGIVFPFSTDWQSKPQTRKISMTDHSVLCPCSPVMSKAATGSGFEILRYFPLGSMLKFQSCIKYCQCSNSDCKCTEMGLLIQGIIALSTMGTTARTKSKPIYAVGTAKATQVIHKSPKILTSIAARHVSLCPLLHLSIQNYKVTGFSLQCSLMECRSWASVRGFFIIKILASRMPHFGL